MERTPSPPRRVRTPPAPLHGAKYDSYEPFSPRRSSRVAAQQHLRHEQTSPTHPRATRDVTPTSSKKKTATRTSHTLSPPSSPISPAKHGSPRSTRRPNRGAGALDSDSDHVAPTPSRRFLSTMAPHGMLPTPAKTPRKRPLQSEESLGSTARVLFANRTATVEEAMPSPSNARKSKHAYTLGSFEESVEAVSEKIEIYTDSKERIPTRNEEEDNPFVTRKGKGKATAAPSKPRKVDEKTEKMVQAVRRDEGVMYNFRGRKIFRPFHDGAPSNTSEDGPQSSGDELLHKVGPEARRKLRHTDITPRLLFQDDIARLNCENSHEDDEEADTEIEATVATPCRKAHKSEGTAASAVQEATPPPTSRVKRQISFDSWSRVKSSARGSSVSRDGRKRAGPPLESAADKRARTR